MDNLNSDPNAQPVDQNSPGLSLPVDQSPPDLMASPDVQPVVPDSMSPPDQSLTPNIQPSDIGQPGNFEDLLQPSNDPFSNLSLSTPPDPFLDVGQPQFLDMGQPDYNDALAHPDIGQFAVGSYSPTVYPPSPANYSPPISGAVQPPMTQPTIKKSVVKRHKKISKNSSVLKTSRSK